LERATSLRPSVISIRITSGLRYRIRFLAVWTIAAMRSRAGEEDPALTAAKDSPGRVLSGRTKWAQPRAVLETSRQRRLSGFSCILTILSR
jgi:hypothetical protein